MSWERIESLIERLEKELEVERKKEEMITAFVKEFGIEPQKTTVEKAFSVFRDKELPERVRHIIYDLLNNLNIEYDYFELHIQVYRTIADTEPEWKASKSTIITLEKIQNKLHYIIEIFPCFEDEDC